MARDLIEIPLTHPSVASRELIDFAATRHITPATERLYDGAVMVPYDEQLFRAHDVKRGLRNADGSGVVAGLTRISDVHGYRKDADGAIVPDEGKLTICGYDLEDLVSHAQEEGRFGYEEIVYLLLTGELPRADELQALCDLIGNQRLLPSEYIAEFPITTASKNIMNVLQRAVLLLYAFDATPDATDPAHEIDVALSLLGRLPRIAAIAHVTRAAELEGRRAHIPRPNPGFSMAETILHILREGDDFTREEALLLDVMLMLHAEHGGGNNSTFACRVLSSSATDAYSAYAAAIGSLKGPRHGGANSKVTAMHADIRAHVRRWDDDGEIAGYLTRILNREAFDGAGLIYGMGHAVYTRSVPRARLCRRYAAHLAEHSGLGDEFHLIERVERLAPAVMRDVRGTAKPICANIDLYTGFIYQMLGVPEDLITPLFAVARMAGWAAHRMEELYGANRIIRPAYNSVMVDHPYIPLAERTDQEA